MDRDIDRDADTYADIVADTDIGIDKNIFIYFHSSIYLFIYSYFVIQ